MAKSNNSSPASDAKAANKRQAHAVRETVESVVIAFVLAFLFRTFEAEAFVIPTGSMATTLMGRHKDLECANCGIEYRVSASEEVDADRNVMLDAKMSVAACTCPNCRYSMLISSDPKGNPQDISYPSYKGDRIIVSKAAYDLSDPRRWDVIVFRFPEDAKTNFIKRLVGLPNETIKIYHGDVFTRVGGADEPFNIAHKEGDKVLAMRQLVYDNNYVVDEMLALNWPARWQADTQEEGGWVSTDGTRSFAASGSSAEPQWMHYQHFVPTAEDWQTLAQGPIPDGQLVEPQLVTDFTAYNAGKSWGKVYLYPSAPDPYPTSEEMGWHWVGDLLVECELEVRSDKGQVTLELVEGRMADTGDTARFQCVLDIATGEAKLQIPGLDSFSATAKNAVQGPGTYELKFANFDDQLFLWVNGDLVSFEGETAYPPLKNQRPYREDLKPVGIATLGADVKVSDLRIFRDIYYSSASAAGGSLHGGNTLIDFAMGQDPYSRIPPRMSGDVLAEFYRSPQYWDAFDHLVSATFELEEEQFFVLGDNSARSKDGRLWRVDQHYVERDMLIGKALFIYWPHSLNKPVPFTPNFKRMKFVR